MVTPEIPGWVQAAIAAILAFIGAWAALRVTVGRLAKDVAALVSEVRSLVLSVNTLQVQANELGNIRANLHGIRNDMTKLGLKVARIEVHLNIDTEGEDT